MGSPDRSQFYTGFVADHYDLLVPEDEAAESYAFFRRAIEAGGQPALELACGTGRPLLSYVRAGLDVEGLDASADMLAICRRKAAELGVSPRLHQGRMESFDLGRRFRTIFVVTSSFMLLTDPAAVRSALARIFAHLEPSGRFLCELHVPADPDPAHRERFRTFRKSLRSDGGLVRCRGRVVRYDAGEQILESLLRYEVQREGRLEHEEERRFRLRWHTPEQMVELLAEAGFGGVGVMRRDGTPTAAGDSQFVVVGERGGSPAAPEV